MDAMIEAVALSKSYGSLHAVREVSFRVEPGEVVGFLGPNGAGKSTTMRMLTGFLPASGGDARVAGFDVFEDPMEVKKRVGYLPETPPLYPELTVGDYLRFIAELRGFGGREAQLRVGRAMERVGLVGWERRILGSLSKGYRQRVGVAQAILHEPPVLILDEPTSGLDPGQVAGMRDLIRSLAGVHTVILSTHILSEVEALCPRAVVIAGGQVRADGPLEELRARAPGGAWTYVEVRGLDARTLGEADGVARVEPLTDDAADGFAALRVTARDGADPRASIAAMAAARGAALRALELRAPTLEEAFLAITGRE
jgi:ABC-2 type transport system ATP-binding protein